MNFFPKFIIVFFVVIFPLGMTFLSEVLCNSQIKELPGIILSLISFRYIHLNNKDIEFR